jgi:hypothetical protein
MPHPITYYAHKIADKAHAMVYGYELEAHPKHLKWVLRHSKEELLRYQFKEGSRRYSVLEYSIKCEDEAAIAALIKLGVDCNLSSANSGKSALHFFIDCLQENHFPHLGVLTLLLDHSDVNVEESSSFHTPLEWALMRMAFYSPVHWEVVELLLQKGSRVVKNERTNTTPFMILKDAYHARMIRNIAEEKLILERFMRYIELEKKYHPESDSSLTLEEFKLHTSNLHGIITNAALVTSQHRKYSEEKNESRDESLDDQGLSDHYEQTHEVFAVYQKCFQTLVKSKRENAFEECFASWELPVISVAVARNLFKSSSNST